ncbi:MAG: hypothetical protein AAGD06_14175 [Acidobacteriota bacterium]
MSEQTTLTIDGAKLDPSADLDGLRGKALVIGIAGALATVGGYFVAGEKVFYRGYLIGWVYWLGIALGLFMLCMVTHLANGRFGIQMHRVQEGAGRTVPFFFLAGLPILFGGMHTLFPWDRPEALHDALVLEKMGYLKRWMEFEGPNPEWMYWVPGFMPRYAIYFLVWTIWAFVMSSLSKRHDETGDHSLVERQQKWSAGGLVVFVMVATFASVDWLMSTEPHWFSSLYGPQMLIWQALSAVAFTIPLMAFLAARKPLDHLVKKSHWHDHGKLLLAFTMVWGYFTVSQYLIIWSGNLPEEVPWYLYRNTEGWKYFTIAVVLGSFLVPFVALLSQDIKFKPKTLIPVALVVLVFRWFDYYWQVAPNLHKYGFTINPFDFAPWVGIGGLWVWLFLGQLKDRPIVPVEHPVIKEAWSDG